MNPNTTERTVEVQTFINDGPGRFMGYEPGDKLYPGPVLQVRILDDGNDLNHRLLDLAWAIGNRQGVDAFGEAWPSWVRSLSVGDVLAIRAFAGGPLVAWGVDSFGFKALGAIKDAVSVGPLAVESERQAWALAVSLSEFGRQHEHPFGAPVAPSEPWMAR